MKLSRFRRKGTAFRVALAVLLALLFQHVAIAAYACPLGEMPAPADVSMVDCDGMGSVDSLLLCDSHCNPDNSTPSDSRAAQIPPVVLPQVRFDLARTLPAWTSRHFYDSAVAPTDGPARLRFCSLLI